MGCLFSTNKLFLVLSRTSFSSVHGTDFWWVLISDAFFSSHCCFQNKCYPKDSAKDALCKGRVRVQLKQSDNSFFNEKFQSSKWCLVVVIEHLTSAQLVTLAGIFLYNNAVIYYFFLPLIGKALFLFLGEMIPKLKSRQSKSSQSDSSSQQQGAGASSKKKKGKKGKGKWNKLALFQQLFSSN